MVKRYTKTIPLENATQAVVNALDSHLGVLLSSGFEYPGRYTRWDLGFVNPPLKLICRQRFFSLTALNDRGKHLLGWMSEGLLNLDCIESGVASETEISGGIRQTSTRFSEEDRSKQPSIFSLIRWIGAFFFHEEDPYLGLFGAFGYDLAFQFESITFSLPRQAESRDLVLYFPDEITIVDHNMAHAEIRSYDFGFNGQTTEGLFRSGSVKPYRGADHVEKSRDRAKGDYAELVREAHQWFRRGDLFEVVPGQSFYEPCLYLPSEVFRYLKAVNPAPYATLMNLDEEEYLIGASPEMYVRSDGRRIETCPISGTIARGVDPIEDAQQVLRLLNSEKEASELTMCTDVDRNDKSRICVADSVRVIGRRQIEMYSKLIHTVDHVEGILRPGFDVFDAFLSHTWAVTVTGAPKLWAMRFIESHEVSCRHWYGGAIGWIGFDGNINTGLTLRTMRVHKGIAEIRAGGTLLADSDPDAEEAETELKAKVLLEAVRHPFVPNQDDKLSVSRCGVGKKILLIDHEDSFVHTLANYFRQTGASVTTLRTGFSRPELAAILTETPFSLIVLSPGPGSPSDFALSDTIDVIMHAKIPIFGICLGLQGLVEYFGGSLNILPYPVHGKASEIAVFGGKIFDGLPAKLEVGRYHSLYANREDFPVDLTITAQTVTDQIVMAIEHQSAPVAAVQFHPESILSLKENSGLTIVQNVVKFLAKSDREG